jgi:histidine triad (HIT) family protein
VADGECLFCRLAREGEHVRSSERFVAIRDINPKADVHLLVLPRRHIPTFRDVGQLGPGEAKEMVDFVAATAREAGLEDYRLQINVGRGGGQEVLHLHWHVLGRRAA